MALEQLYLADRFLAIAIAQIAFRLLIFCFEWYTELHEFEEEEVHTENSINSKEEEEEDDTDTARDDEDDWELL
ncbi:unnamed protein product [Caenorhabditis brenneri]